MAKRLQIELPEHVYADLVNLAQAIRQPPEEMAAEWVTMAVSALTGRPIQMAKSMSTGIPRGLSERISPSNAPDAPGAGRGKRPEKQDQIPPRTPNKEAANSIYQLKVTLKDSKPPIWRRIHVPGIITLLKLHGALQVVMGWDDNHLHQYIVDGVFYGTRDREFEMIDSGTEIVNERGVKLCQIAPDVGSRFVYEYDFGDGWQHQVVVEKLLPAKPGAAYPVCIAGKRACPPEDVGGVWGYSDFLKVIRDPSHPERDEMLKWAGGDFDPEEFNMEEVNDALKRIR